MRGPVRPETPLHAAQLLCILLAPLVIFLVNQLIGRALDYDSPTRTTIPLEIADPNHCHPADLTLAKDHLLYDDPCIEAITGRTFKDGKIRDFMPQEVGARYLWMLSFAIAALGGMVLIGCAAFFASRDLLPRDAAVLIVVALAISYGVAVSLDAQGYFFNSYFHQNLRLFLKNLEMPPPLHATANGFFTRATRFGDYLALLAIGMYLFAMAALCRPAGIKDVAALPEQVPTLTQRVQDLQVLLYVAATALALAMIASRAAMEWPFAIFKDPNSLVIADIRALDSGILALWGFYFSLFLIGGYVPAALALARQGRLAIPASLTAYKDRQDWLDQNGLKISLSSQLLTILAFLAPFLTGASSSVSGKLLFG
jgi:hypothetical protein